MKYDLEQTVVPASAVLTASELRDHLRLDSTDQDAYLDTLIEAATRSLEAETARQFINATWVMRLPEFWGSGIDLPRSPLVSVSSVVYVDTNGVTQTLASSQYDVMIGGDVGRIETAYGVTLPSTRSTSQAVTVTFVAGYGSAASDVPENVRHAVRFLAAHWYANAEPIAVGTIASPIPETIKRLVSGFTVRVNV